MSTLRGAVLVAGTTSDAGKSTLVAGICRWLHRQGVRVAPFKAQNMSNNSAVTPDGGEIGRAQAMQAAACGLEPSVRFNPVLLKPGSDGRSQVVVLGHARGHTGAGDYRQVRAGLADTVAATLADLRAEYDVVVCEGAGSPAEINLRAGDLANMGLARAAGLPTIVVGDIDRGGFFASAYGTLALLSPADQALVAGFVVNRFRGDRELLRPGLEMLTGLTGRPTLGVLPYEPDLWLDTEDSLGYTDGRLVGRPAAPRSSEPLRVAVVRLPRISNATDVEAIAAEPGVLVRLTASPDELIDADLVVLPGSKSTVDDLDWLRRRGLADAVRARAAAGRPVLGLCGGYQMLAETLDDPVESGAGRVDGLGLLPVDVVFEPDKTLARPHGTALGAPVTGYEIHHGRATVRYDDAHPSFLTSADGAPEGCRSGAVFGTHWHGAFECDEFRRRFLTEIAGLAGRRGFEVALDTDFRALRERSLDRLGDLVEHHLDTTALTDLIRCGPPATLPFVPPGAPPDPSADGAVPEHESVSGPTTASPADNAAAVPPTSDGSVQPGPVEPTADGPGATDPATDTIAVLAGQTPDPLAAGPPPARPPEPWISGRPTVETYAGLADEILTAPPHLGPVRLVSVDGRAGSGKTTFAARLTEALTHRGARTELIHTDDLLQGWLDIVTFWPRLEEWVLAPLRRGKPAGYHRFDWHAGRFRTERVEVGLPDVLVLEGVTTARAIVRPELSRSVFVQVARRTRFDRGVSRDGPGVVPDWTRWMQDEDVHFAADRTNAHVDVLVDGDPRTAHSPTSEFVRINPDRAPARGCP
ncbi:hypothetical protein GCM10022220_26910 [Actinocatenispora rupis]|uniref:Cobyric acid synthase n=1 Tax=Actinocatenispora rupis TaxID=519421 RepID=A0A8J3J8L0_9ACTN|nr:hypothetical protein Aru02nite_22570 [Actinocatenispora rupis]